MANKKIIIRSGCCRICQKALFEGPKALLDDFEVLGKKSYTALLL